MAFKRKTKVSYLYTSCEEPFKEKKQGRRKTRKWIECQIFITIRLPPCLFGCTLQLCHESFEIWYPFQWGVTFKCNILQVFNKISINTWKDMFQSLLDPPCGKRLSDDIWNEPKVGSQSKPMTCVMWFGSVNVSNSFFKCSAVASDCWFQVRKIATASIWNS